MPELVSFSHREKTKEKSNAPNERPKVPAKGCDLSQSEDKTNKTTKQKTTSKSKSLLGRVWLRTVFH